MSAKKEGWMGSPETLASYERLLAAFPEVERKGATMPYTSWNGNMFSYLDKDGTLALRLPVGAREEFMEKYHTRLHESYGIVQKEYVDIPTDLLANTDELRPYFELSLVYVKTLRPKPTKR